MWNVLSFGIKGSGFWGIYASLYIAWPKDLTFPLVLLQDGLLFYPCCLAFCHLPTSWSTFAFMLPRYVTVTPLKTGEMHSVLHGSSRTTGVPQGLKQRAASSLHLSSEHSTVNPQWASSHTFSLRSLGSVGWYLFSYIYKKILCCAKEKGFAILI